MRKSSTAIADPGRRGLHRRPRSQHQRLEKERNDIMNITDPKALKVLKQLNCVELNDLVYDFPEDERDGDTDMDIIERDALWMVEMYEEPGTVLYDDLADAKEILRETKYGKVIPLRLSTLEPKYKQHQIQTAKNIYNEYRRLVNFRKRMKA
jgi:hypothetical protein